MSGKREKKLRKAIREEARIILAQDPRSGLAFKIDNVKQETPPEPQKPAEPPLSPEERELTKLFKTFATTVWRMRNVLYAPGAKDHKCSIEERGISRLARYVETLNGALEDAHVQVKGDYNGNPYDEGDAVKVITFEDRPDLARDEYIETFTPTIRWTDKDGKPRLLQQAEVVVGKALHK